MFGNEKSNVKEETISFKDACKELLQLLDQLRVLKDKLMQSRNVPAKIRYEFDIVDKCMFNLFLSMAVRTSK